MSFKSYSSGHSSYDEKECEEEKDCNTMNSPSSTESSTTPPPNKDINSSPLSMTDSDDSLPPPPPNEKFCFSSPSTIDSEVSLPPPPPPDDVSNSTSPASSRDNDTRPPRADHTTSSESEHSVVLSRQSYIKDERTSCGSHADDVGETSDIDELPDSIRFDYSSMSFSSHSSIESTNLPQQLSSQQRLDPPARCPDLERQTNVALQTCFSPLSSDSFLSSYDNQSTVKIEELQSKRLVFTTLQSHVHQKKRINKALEILDRLSQNATMRKALIKWATINKRLALQCSMIQARSDRLLKRVLSSWRELTRRESDKRQSLWLMMVFNRWKIHVDDLKEEKERDLVALLHWANNLTTKAFSALRMYAKESKRLNKHVGFSFGQQRFVCPSSSTGKYLSNSRESSFISYRSPKPSMIFNKSPGSNHLGQSSSYSSDRNYDVSRLNNTVRRTGDMPRLNNDVTRSRTVDMARFSPFLRASSVDSSILSSLSSRNGGVLKVNRTLGRTIEQHADQTTERSESQPPTVIQKPPSVTFASDCHSQTRRAAEAASVSNGRQREYNLSYRPHNTTLASQIQRPGSQFTSTRPNFQARGDRQANSSPQYPWDET